MIIVILNHRWVILLHHRPLTTIVIFPRSVDNFCSALSNIIIAPVLYQLAGWFGTFTLISAESTIVIRFDTETPYLHRATPP